MSKQVEFNIIYDGEALQDHSMDVRDLAPALLSLGLLFDEANRVLNEDKASVKLHVKAQEPGSFNIIFELFQEPGIALSIGKRVLDILTVIGSVAGGVGGIYGAWRLIQKLKGKTPEKITDLQNGYFRIEHKGETLDVDINTMKVFRDIPFRKATEEVLEPIRKEGIDSFEVKYREDILHKVTEENVEYYTLEEQPEESIVEDSWVRAYI